MDGEFRHSSQGSQSADNADSSSFRHPGQYDAQCIVCRRAFTVETEVNEGLEAICICRDCKMMVLEGNETSITIRDSRRRRRQRGRRRYGSPESLDDFFSHQFSQLISLVRQNHEAQVYGDNTANAQQQTSFNSVQGRVRRWQRTFSDNDSDGFYQTDSMFGESDSNISFGGYGGESDASLDGHSLVDREISIQLDNESHADTDTDIDPMRAGLDRWNSDDQDEEDGGWEEVDVDESIRFMEPRARIHDVNNNRSGNDARESPGSPWISWSLRGNLDARYHTDNYAGSEDSEVILPFVGNPGDYLDARGFEELLDHLAETEGPRRGAPPAATSVVVKLPSVVITKEHEKNGCLVCAVCKDPLAVNTEVKQLPCMHLYHPPCILPWLNARNSCPVCRYELPTDDLDYEEVKRSMNRSELLGVRQQGRSSSDVSSDSEADEGDGRADQGNAVESAVQVEDRPNREGGRMRWLFLAAAPIVSIVGISLVLWFRNPPGNGGIECDVRERSRQQRQRSRGASATVDASNRRWWSLA